MKYSIPFTLMMFLAFYALRSQVVSVEGKITDDSGIPLYGAHILVKESRQVSVSDNSGHYSLNKLAPATYTIIVTYVGYQTQEMTIALTESVTNLDFALEEAAYLTEEAVITATGNKVARKDVSPAISIVDRETLEESKESALLPVISEEVPGVFVTERGITGFGVATGSAGHINIRGVGGNPNTGVLVLLDGSPQYMGLFGHPLPDAYVTTDAEKVEVIRGPASMMYGSNAMAGVINIISRHQKEDGLGGRARFMYGSFNTWKASANAGYKNKGFSVFASINHDQTDGHRDNSSFDITNGYLKLTGALGKNFRIIADGSIAAFNTIDPGPFGTLDSSYLLQEHWIDIQRNMVSLSVENTFPLFEGGIKLFYNSGRHKLYDGFLSNDYNYGLSLYENYKLLSNTTLSAGFDFKNYGGKAENELAMMGQGITFADTSLYELGGYLMARYYVGERWILTAGLRLNYQNSAGEEWVPQAGINFLLNANHILKASVSKGFRYPTIRELYMWQPANPELLPERMWCYEGSYLGSIPGIELNYEFTAFYQQGSNLIQTIGQYPNIIYENTGEFSHYGLEVAAGIKLWQYFRLESNYSWLHMDEAVVGAPEHKLFAAIKFNRSNISINLNGMYVQDLYTRTSPESMQTYFLLNARLSYTFLDMISLWISGDNLLDREYEINYAYPMPGISFMAGIDVNFNVKKK